MEQPLADNETMFHGIMEQNRVLQHMNDDKSRRIAVLEQQVAKLKAELTHTNE